MRTAQMIELFAGPPCADRFQVAIELLGQRWTGAILARLLASSARFHDVMVAVPGMSPRLLAVRFRYLVAAGIVTRAVLPTTPVHVCYDLTDKGRAAAAALVAVADWARTWDTSEPAAAMPVEAAGAAARRVEFLYVEDCPGWRPALASLRVALAADVPEAALHLVEITSDAQAQAQRFQGSPTIRLNGRDIEQSTPGQADYGVACRVYSQPAGGLGTEALPAFLAAALRSETWTGETTA